MELLTTISTFESLPERRFVLCSADSWSALSKELHASSRYFALLILADSRKVPDDTIRQTADVLLLRGLATLCAWGPDCERVHDLFDAVEVETGLGRRNGWGPNDVVMTTWHDEETLPEMLWDFAFCAYPTDYFVADCKDWIVAVIGNTQWEEACATELQRLSRIRRGARHN